MFTRKSYIIGQQFMRFFFPTVLMTMALSMSIVVDGMIVGNLLGPDALAAVNLVLPVTLIFNSFYALLAVGGATLYAVAMGRRDKKRARELFTLSVGTMAIVSLAAAVVGAALSPQIALALTAKAPNLTELVLSYLRIVMLAAPLLILTPGLVYFVRASGKVKLASATLITANVVNILLDLFNMGVLKTGIGGAAFATAGGYLVGLVIAIYGVVKSKELRPLPISPGTVFELGKEIVATGAPGTINTVLNFFRLTCINAIVMVYLGSDGVTAFSVCTSCLSIVSMFVGGSAQTLMPLLGTLYGEGDVKGIRFSVRRAVTITGAASLALFVIFELFPAQITGLFGVRDAVQVAIATTALRIYAVSLPLMGILFVAICVYPVLGFKSLSSFVAFLEGFAIVVPAAFFLSKAIGHLGIWLAFPLGEGLTLVILCFCAKWIQKKRPELSGIYLLEKDRKEETLDVTMVQEIGQAAELSQAAIDFCRKNGVTDSAANRVGVALEEMAVNTIRQKGASDKSSYLDVRLTRDGEMLRLCMRDNGRPYDPFSPKNGEEPSDNIRMVTAIADHVSYDYILGMNSSIITIKNERVQNHA